MTYAWGSRPSAEDLSWLAKPTKERRRGRDHLSPSRIAARPAKLPKEYKSLGSLALGVSGLEVSVNQKLGPVAVTLVSQASCPASCPLLRAGCYAELGLMGARAHERNRSILNRFHLAEVEAEIIREMSGERPLRLHVVGDSAEPGYARIVSEVAGEYRAKRGQPVWTYTHAWRDVPREAWGDVSVLASCEKLGGVKDALAAGYAAALIVPGFEQEKAYPIAPGLKGLPCPEMTGRVKNCAECLICTHDKRLRETGTVVLFAAHGAMAPTVKGKLDSADTLAIAGKGVL